MPLPIKMPYSIKHKDTDVLDKQDDIDAATEIYIDRRELVVLRIDMEDLKALEIFNKLPAIVLPVLPPGYQWSRAKEKYSVIREKSAPKYKLSLRLYGPSKSGKVNCIFRVDDKTIWSFAHASSCGHGRKGEPPMSGDDYHVDGFPYMEPRPGVCFKNHMRGHLIDDASTIMRRDRDYWSTYDPYNYVPEPPNRHWGIDI